MTGNRPLQNYLTLLGNDSVTELLNTSQLYYLQQFVGVREKCLSSVCPAFNLYIDDELGNYPLKEIVRNLQDTIYPAELVALELSGKDLRIWLEMMASIYQKPQKGRDTFLQKEALTFLFYPIAGLEYEIEIDHEALYDQFGNIRLDRSGLGRIGTIYYNGNPITDDEQFTLITNCYAPFLKRAQWQGNHFIKIGNVTNLKVLDFYVKALDEALDKVVEAYPLSLFNAIKIRWNWYLTSHSQQHLFLPTSQKILKVPKIFTRNYTFIKQQDEPLGFELGIYPQKI